MLRVSRLMKSKADFQSVLVYVFGPGWACYSATLLALTAASGSGPVTLPAGGGAVPEDGQLLNGADLLPEQVKLALNLVEAALCIRELGAELLGLRPQTPGPPAEVGPRHDE
jgi:hypothetical protein